MADEDGRHVVRNTKGEIRSQKGVQDLAGQWTDGGRTAGTGSFTGLQWVQYSVQAVDGTRCPGLPTPRND